MKSSRRPTVERRRLAQGIGLQPFVREFNLPRARFEELVEGVEMDLRHVRYETFGALVEYCRRVASAVGLICIEIFGYRNQGAGPTLRIWGWRFN